MWDIAVLGWKTPHKRSWILYKDNVTDEELLKACQDAVKERYDEIKLVWKDE